MIDGTDISFRRLSELTRELHELRSQQCQEPSSAATATEYISYGDDYAMEQQLQDDLTFSENTASLKGVVVDGAIILKAFQTYVPASLLDIVFLVAY